MNKRARGFVIAASVAALAVALAGCSGSSTSGDETVTISFTGSDSLETYEPVIAAFEEAHPGIEVEYTQIPQDSFDSTLLQRLLASDTSIDVFTVDQPSIAQYAASGVLYDLSDYSDRARDAFPVDQYEVNFYGDTMWALPVWTSTQLLFYNKDAFTAAGVPFPSAETPLTWEELRDVAAQVQAGAGLSSGFSFENPETYGSILPMMASLGGGTGIVGDDGLGVDITNDAWVEALTFYQQLFEDGIAPRGTGQLSTDSYFSGGGAALFISGPWSVGGYLPGGWAEATIDWGVAPYPYFADGERVTPTGAWSWSVNPASEHVEESLAFIEFASLTTEGNSATVAATTIIPSQLEAAAEYFPALEAQAGEHGTGLAAILTDQNENTAFARPVTIGWVQFQSIVNSAISDIVNGSDVETRLGQAQTELEDAFAALR